MEKVQKDEFEGSKGVPATNWAAVFMAYATGADPFDVAQMFGITESTIARVAERDDWPALVARANETKAVQIARQQSSKVTIANLISIDENREKNYKMFNLLREELVERLVELKTGTLRFEQIFSNKGDITTALRAPGAGDRASLANAARIIAEGTSKCLGDFQGGGSESLTGSLRNNIGGVASITILVPGVVSDQNGKPRKPDHLVVDLRGPTALPESAESD